VWTLSRRVARPRAATSVDAPATATPRTSAEAGR
jgi:hypothetical protein